MSTEDNFRNSTENLDEAAGGAPSDEFLDKVDPADFGTTDESEDDEDTEGDETGDSTAEGDEDSGGPNDASDDPDSGDEESRG